MHLLAAFYGCETCSLTLKEEHTSALCKFRGLTLLFRVGTLWRCGDGLFFEVPPLASDAFTTTLHPILENVLQTVDHFENSCLGASFSWLEKPRNRMGERSGLYGGCSNGVPPMSVSVFIATFQSRNAGAPLRFSSAILKSVLLKRL
jgi:hypothetical protein